ncbi:MAG TPA: STAS domain-containing protein [Anaerolineaceae bacterium]|nr:STAS domain-containing protein [Anaerolineaceae bacterium]
MEFKITDYKHCSVVKGLGRIDSATSPDLEKVLGDLIPSNKGIVLDMTDIDFVSSAGWWTIIRAQKELKKANHELTMAGVNDNVKDSMDLIGILPYFCVFENVVDAIGNF